ncbi:3-dehydroquinate synthase [Candidatus Peregrinibacteria bacterium]|nr:3-dehydroquinate synthase [Candidatus Peregrinibacteria bacterium]
MRTVTLRPPATRNASYSILIGEESLKELPKLIGTLGHFDSVAILHDEAVAPVAENLQKRLTASCRVSIPSEERSKSLKEVARIVSELLRNGVTRQSLLLNVGGGMVTDLGGFVASVYMRGIAFLNVPTTLLGMVDASVGGKTGVNLREAKNVIGHYHHPKAVIIDIHMLESLPEEQFREGLVEVIKIAAIADAAFFETFERELPALLARDNDALCSCIADAVRLKAQIVGDDVQDEGRRLLLNFGHTVGHALEVLSNFHLSHAKAISIGMVQEMSLARTKDAPRVTALLQAIGMPTEFPENCATDDLFAIMQKDKKTLDHDERFAAPTTIGMGAVLRLTADLFHSLP